MPIVIRLDVVMAQRKVRGIDLAERIGLTQANLSKLKAGRIKAIRMKTLESLCRELQCQPGELLVFVPGASGEAVEEEEESAQEA